MQNILNGMYPLCVLKGVKHFRFEELTPPGFPALSCSPWGFPLLPFLAITNELSVTHQSGKILKGYLVQPLFLLIISILNLDDGQ